VQQDRDEIAAKSDRGDVCSRAADLDE
jgi:hypothetical protein